MLQDTRITLSLMGELIAALRANCRRIRHSRDGKPGEQLSPHRHHQEAAALRGARIRPDLRLF